MTGQPQQDTMFDALTCDALDLIEHLGDDVELRKWPERLHTLYEVHRQYNLRRGMTPEQASVDARDRCILLGDYIGGRSFILPRGDALRAALRDKLIWLEFSGNNHDELAARYTLHITQVYRILREQRALYRERHQGRLFDQP